MDLAPFVVSLNRAVAAAGTAGGEEAEAFLARFAVPLESAIRLTLLEVVSAAADEIAADLKPGSVDVVLRGSNPGFRVTVPKEEPPPSASGASAPAEPPSAQPAADGATARVTLRIPETVKLKVDEIAGLEGLSANAWLARVITAAVGGSGSGSRAGDGLRIGQGYSGWSR
ncbi:hypothetical protein C5F59_009910 [Streptomyces sp. QL37]|uniref:hypothetical protein n=1 Tax=Streptomyces sp. QL37 TaxID=2093747 RepID=UPI000CF23303|nr:hypothetical protein [Streptomyces sp. QL37]PPQ60239.1 hypothetical protein C5F59_28850 [Streptomyces sp. QL37]